MSPGEEERSGQFAKNAADEPHGDAEHSPTDDEYACRDQGVKRSVQREKYVPPLPRMWSFSTRRSDMMKAVTKR